MPEQGRLLVTCHAGDGNPGPAEQVTGGGAVDFGGGFDLGQHGAGHRQEAEQVLVPGQVVDVVHQGAGGIGIVGDMGLAIGEFPDEPGVDGAEEQVALLRLLPGPRHLIQDPLYLGAGEVGVDEQAGFLPHRRLVALLLQLLADTGRLPRLPHDGPVHRLPRVPVPDHGRLPLVRDAHGRHFLHLHPRQHLSYHGPDGGPDFQGVVLHPARLREVLRKFFLRQVHHLAGLVEENGPGAGRALVEGEDVFFFHGF